MKLTIPGKFLLPLLLAAFVLVLNACSAPPATPEQTHTALFTPTSTSTILWFPPTETPTPFPTQTPLPTQDYRPGLGNLIFSDSFDQPELWNTTSSDQASAEIARGRLILSVNGLGPLMLFSLRSQPILGDFYAEAEADISLCSIKDQYGLVFHASPGDNYYRFVINCNSQLRLERVRGGVTYPLIEWVPSGDAPSGAPAQVKMGIWAVGREMRFFLNDHYQFSLSDPVFSSGTIGFFVFCSGQMPVTVSFSNFSVYSVFYSSPTPTLAPIQTTFPTPNP